MSRDAEVGMLIDDMLSQPTPKPKRSYAEVLKSQAWVDNFIPCSWIPMPNVLPWFTDSTTKDLQEPTTDAMLLMHNEFAQMIHAAQICEIFNVPRDRVFIKPMGHRRLDNQTIQDLQWYVNSYRIYFMDSPAVLLYSVYSPERTIRKGYDGLFDDCASSAVCESGKIFQFNIKLEKDGNLPAYPIKRQHTNPVNYGFTREELLMLCNCAKQNRNIKDLDAGYVVTPSIFRNTLASRFSAQKPRA